MTMTPEELINPVIEKLQSIKSGDGDVFDMTGWVTKNECGTTACIGGWIALIHAPEKIGTDILGELRVSDIPIIATELLSEVFGATIDLISLFHKHGHALDGSDEFVPINEDDAIRTLKHLRDTGVVKWEFEDACI